MAQRSDTLEIVYIDVEARGDNLEPHLRKIVDSAKRIAEEASKAAQDVLKAGFEQAMEGVRKVVEDASSSGKGFDGLRKSMREVGEQAQRTLEQAEKLTDGMEDVGRASVATAQRVKDYASLMATLRSDFVSGRISQDQFRSSASAVSAEMDKLRRTAGLTVQEHQKLAASMALAQRAFDTMDGKASRLGLAMQVQIGLANQFGQALRSVGPAGQVAAGGLGLIQGAFSSLGQPVESFHKAMHGIMQTLTRLPSIIAIASGAALVGLSVALTRVANQAAELADTIDKSAQSAGMSVESWQELSFALGQYSVTQDQVRQGLNDFNARLGQAAMGSSGIVRAYQTLGVAIRDVNGGVRDGDTVFTELIERLSRVGSAAEQAALGGLVFGEEFSRRLLPAINAGADSMAALRQQARDLGLILSGEAVMSLVEYRDQMRILQQQFQTARVEIAAAFLPLLQRVLIPLIQNQIVPLFQAAADRVMEFATRFLEAGEAGDQFRAGLARLLAPLFQFADTIIGIGQAFAGFANLVVGGAAAAGAAIGALSVQVEAWLERMRGISEVFRGAYDPITILTRFAQLGTLDWSNPFDADAIASSAASASDAYFDRAYALAAEGRERLLRAWTGDYSGVFDPLVETLSGAINQGANRGFTEFQNIAGTAAANAKRTVEDVFRDIDVGGTNAQKLAEVYGNSLARQAEAINSRIRLITNGIDELVRMGLDANDERIKYLLARLEALRTELSAVERQMGSFNLTPAQIANEQAPLLVPEGGLPVAAVRRIEKQLADAWARAAAEGTRDLRLDEDALQGQWSGLGPNWDAMRAQQTREARAAAQAAAEAARFEQMRADATARYVVASQAALRADEDGLQAAWDGMVNWDYIRRQERLAAERALEAERRLGAERAKVQAATTAAIRADEDAAQAWWGYVQRSRQAILDLQAAQVARSSRDLRMDDDALQSQWTGIPDRFALQRQAQVRAAQLAASAEEALEDARIQLASVTGDMPSEVDRLRARLEELATQFKNVPGFVERVTESLDALAEYEARVTAEAAAKAAEEFRQTIAKAGVEFANVVVNGIKNGDFGSVVSGAAGIGGNLLQSVLGGWQGILIGGLVSIFGGALGSLFGGGENERRQREAENRSARSTPAVNINFNFTQTNYIEAAVNSPAFQNEMRRQAELAFSDFMVRSRMDQRLPGSRST